MAALFTVLLLWQAVVAPMAHAMQAHAGHVAVVAQVVTEAPGATEAAAMPCHGHEADGTEAMPSGDGVVAAHGAGHAAEVPSDHGDGPDCCKSLDCQCACAHASLASPGVPVAAQVVPDHPPVLGGELPVLRARVVDLFKPPI